MTPEQISLAGDQVIDSVLARLEAAEKYVAADQAYDNAVGHAEYAGAVAAKNARGDALEEWRDARGEGPQSWPISSVQLPPIREDAAKGGT